MDIYYVITFALGVVGGLLLSFLAEWSAQKKYNKIKQSIIDAETDQWEKEKEKDENDL